MGTPHCKVVLGQKFCPVKSGPKNVSFRELRSVKVIFLFSGPEKAHPCAELHLLTYYACRYCFYSVAKNQHFAP